jgi:hypothetical protein
MQAAYPDGLCRSDVFCQWVPQSVSFSAILDKGSLFFQGIAHGMKIE